MGIFNEFFKKEKPVFTGSRFGFGGGSGGAAAASPAPFGGSGGVVSAGVAPGNGYRYHYFKSPGTFDVSPTYGLDGGTLEVLVVAGGGSGGPRVGGGGGAGGIALATPVPIPFATAGTAIPITVGAGGAQGGNSPSSTRGQPGGDSKFGASPDPYYVVAIGGGAGGADDNTSGVPGGSGGGSQYNGSAGAAQQPSQNPGKPWVQNYGHAGSQGAGPPAWQSGAGGGAGGPAGDGDPNNRGEAGESRPIATFTVPLYMPAPDPYRPAINPKPGAHYAGGGGAGDYPPFIAQRFPTGAGYGGGGIGGPSSEAGNGTPGVDGLGGGGGGATGSNDGPLGGAGGAGIVVIRYTV